MALAERLRIGDKHITGKNDEEKIKALHEVCISNPSPHVHVVTTETTRCYGFRQRV